MGEEPVFVAITGTQHYFGTELFKIGLVMQLIKDYGNPHDEEAIRADIPPLGKVGYVANSPNTVPRGCRSAGRVYDTFDHIALAKVHFVVKDTVIAELLPTSEEWHKIYADLPQPEEAEAWSPGPKPKPIRCVVIRSEEES